MWQTVRRITNKILGVKGLTVVACLSFKRIKGKISAQPYTIVKQICFPNGNLLFLSLFSLSKNWMHNVVWGCAETLPNKVTTSIVSCLCKTGLDHLQITGPKGLNKKTLLLILPGFVSLSISIITGLLLLLMQWGWRTPMHFLFFSTVHFLSSCISYLLSSPSKTIVKKKLLKSSLFWILL